MISNRELILKNVCKNKRLDHYCLKKEWYIKRGLLNTYDLILKETFFLDIYENVTLRERLFYIENNLNSLRLCPYCNKHRLIFKPNLLSFTNTCGNKECLSQLKTLNTTIQHKTMSEDVKRIRKEKIIKWQSRPIEEKYGKETADNMKKIYRERLLGKTYEELLGEEKAKEEKRKRKEKFLENNNPMKNLEVRKKVSEKGKITRRTEEYIEKIKKIRLIAAPKQSETLRKKILSGEYTPKCFGTRSGLSFFATIGGNRVRVRSSWEVYFWETNPSLNYETVKIPYVYKNKEHCYFVDFEDKNNKILYEIKPKKLIEEERNKIKIQVAQEWCKKNDYTFQIINEEWFEENLKGVHLENYPSIEKYLKVLKKDNVRV